MSFDLLLTTSQNLQLKPVLNNVDIIFDLNGALTTVTGQGLLIQEVQKIFATPVDYFYTSYSTQIDPLIGSNIGLEATKQTLVQLLLNSLAYLQYLQTEQATYQQVNGQEMLKTITGVNIDYLPEINPNATDSQVQTQFNCQVNIQNAANSTLSVQTALNLV